MCRFPRACARKGSEGNHANRVIRWRYQRRVRRVLCRSAALCARQRRVLRARRRRLTAAPTACRDGAGADSQTQDQTDIWKVKPDISGKRNGVFPRARWRWTSPITLAMSSLFDGRDVDRLGWPARRVERGRRRHRRSVNQGEERRQYVSRLSRRGRERLRPEARNQGGVGRRQRRAVPQQHGHSAGPRRRQRRAAARSALGDDWAAGRLLVSR